MADVGTGTTIAFQSGFLAEILSVDPPNPSREVVDTTHMGSSAKTYMPGDLVDWGELNVRIAHIAATGVGTPIGAAAEEITITFPGSTTWVFDGFMSNYEPTVPLEERMEADVTIKVTGAVVESAGS